MCTAILIILVNTLLYVYISISCVVLVHIFMSVSWAGGLYYLINLPINRKQNILYGVCIAQGFFFFKERCASTIIVIG